MTNVFEGNYCQSGRARQRTAEDDEERSSDCLNLYFRCRCNDEVAWKMLQEKAETDIIAKAYVCDILIHNESTSKVGRDIMRAQQISTDIHYWIAIVDTRNQPATHAIKMYISGICLAQGIGIPKQPARAVACIEEAAELGHCLAQYYVGAWHRDGRGVVKNIVRAVYYFERAAIQGHPIAQNMLGLCYATGRGVIAADDDKAAHWYRLAAAQGLQIAQDNLAAINERRATSATTSSSSTTASIATEPATRPPSSSTSGAKHVHFNL